MLEVTINACKNIPLMLQINVSVLECPFEVLEIAGKVALEFKRTTNLSHRLLYGDAICTVRAYLCHSSYIYTLVIEFLGMLMTCK
jgi:hypothetical protein